MQVLQRVGPVGLRPCVRCQAKKVNERGKVSSRPGPPSPKQQAKKLKEAKKAEQASEAATATQAATAAPTPAIPAQPTASASTSMPASSSPAPPAQPAAPAQPPVTAAAASAPRETPQVVVDRIFARMVACAGVPTITGIGLLVIVYFLKKQYGDDFPLWPAYLSQGFTLVGGLLGITYGALSASWDPSREGSMLGWTEFRANLPLFLSRKQ